MAPTQADPRAAPRSRRQSLFVRAALRRFAAWSAVLLAVLVVASVLIGSRIAQESALREARLRGATIANTVAAPLVDAGVRAGDPAAVEQLGRVMRALMADGDLVRVKLWSAAGKILWSDEKALIDRTFPLEEEVEDLFGTRRVTASVSDLSKGENVVERAEGELIEVYAGTSDVNEHPMVFEAYLSTAPMVADQRRIVLSVLPLVIGGLLLFQLIILPLAASLARRVQQGEAERGRIMRQALRMTAQDRLKIAVELHDGVIQDLAGLSYVMPEVLIHLPETPEAAGARSAVGRAADILRKDVSALRSMMIDIYPPDLHGPGFASAIEDVAQRARNRGVDVEVQIPSAYTATLDASRLAYRVVQEGLRNVVSHAQATQATVVVERQGTSVHVVVSDDGVGIPPMRQASKGHLGLVLLEDTIRDFHGDLRVRPIPGGGTVLEAHFPADLMDELGD